MTTQAVLLGAISGAAVAAATLAFFASGPDVAEGQLAEVHSRLDGLVQRAEDRAQARGELVEGLDGLAERVARLESRDSRRLAASEPGPTGAAAPARTGERTRTASDAAAGGHHDMSAAEFDGLLGKVLRNSMAGTATAEEQERFWAAARTTGLVGATIAALEAAVEQNPRNEEARMGLADAYVAKLLTVPAGPERGIWGVKAEAQWQAVVEQNPDHWDAQYTLAFNYSMYPDFLNKTQDAIDGFERALGIQERVAPEPQHAKTYVHLARMHGKNGDVARAREVLQAGQRRHPRDEDIRKALGALPGK